MKNINEYIKESLLDNEDKLINDNTTLSVSIDRFLKDNYIISGNYIIKNNKSNIVNINGTIVVKDNNISQLTNGLFKFGTVSGDFDCSGCKNLLSLEGSPEEVGGKFNCAGCTSLKSLEGSPKKVGYSFDCSDCSSLKTLKGAPERVGRSFYCYNCTSLPLSAKSPGKIQGRLAR